MMINGNKTITKRDLVVDLSNELGLPQGEVLRVLEAFINHVCDDLTNGDEVVWRGFGTFHITETKPKIGRNPRKPEKEIRIPARAVVKFRPGKDLKTEIAKLARNGR